MIGDDKTAQSGDDESGAGEGAQVGRPSGGAQQGKSQRGGGEGGPGGDGRVGQPEGGDRDGEGGVGRPSGGAEAGPAGEGAECDRDPRQGVDRHVEVFLIHDREGRGRGDGDGGEGERAERRAGRAAGETKVGGGDEGEEAEDQGKVLDGPGVEAVPGEGVEGGAEIKEIRSGAEGVDATVPSVEGLPGDDG